MDPSASLQQALLACTEGLGRPRGFVDVLRAAGCLEEAGPSNRLLAFSNDLANTLPKRAASIDAQIELKATRHRRLLKELAEGCQQLPRRVFRVLVGNDEMLSSLRAIRAAEVSLRNNGYVLTGSATRDRPFVAFLERGGTGLVSAAQTALAGVLDACAAEVQRGGGFGPEMGSESIFYGMPLDGLLAFMRRVEAVASVPPRSIAAERLATLRTLSDVLSNAVGAAAVRRQDHRAMMVPVECLGGHLWASAAPTCAAAAALACALCAAAASAPRELPESAILALDSAVAAVESALGMLATHREAMQRLAGSAGLSEDVWGGADTPAAARERHERIAHALLTDAVSAWKTAAGSEAALAAQRALEQLCAAHEAHAQLFAMFEALGGQQPVLEDYLAAGSAAFRAHAYGALFRTGRHLMLLSLPRRHWGEVLDFLSEPGHPGRLHLRWMHEVAVLQAGVEAAMLPGREDMCQRTAATLVGAGALASVGPREGKELTGLARVALAAGVCRDPSLQAPISRQMRLLDIAEELGMAGTDPEATLAGIMGPGLESAVKAASATELTAARARLALELFATAGADFQTRHVDDLRAAWRLAVTADEEAWEGEGGEGATTTAGATLVTWAWDLFFGPGAAEAAVVGPEEARDIVREAIGDDARALAVLSSMQAAA